MLRSLLKFFDPKPLMRVHISAKWSNFNITTTTSTTTTNYYAKLSQISLVKAELYPILSQNSLPWQLGLVNGKYKKRRGRSEGPLCDRKKEGEVITLNASAAVCAVEWRHCHYDVMQAVWVIIFNTDGQKNWLLNLHQCLLCSPWWR